MENTRLNDIISNLKNTALKAGLNVSDDVIFTRAHSQFISELIEQSKNPKKPIIPKIEQSIPATEKQLNYLNKLKIKYPVNITKKEAIELIKQNA